MRIICLFMILATLLIPGCAQVPKESVQLSVTLGRDLHEMHRTHRELVIKYFSRTKNDINNFIDNKYRPYMIKDSMMKFKLVEKIKVADATNSKPDALDIMNIYVSMVSRRIESYRSELLQNIIMQEDEVLLALDDSYQKLQNANAIVTGHLASIRKVHDAQAELLEKTDLLEFRNMMVDKTIKLSDKVAEITDKANKIDEKMDVKEISDKLKDFVSKFK